MMMQKAFCETYHVGANHRIEVEVPAEFGNQVKLIILPDNDAGVSNESREMMALQEKTGFATSVLGDPAEDVWNDL